MNKDGVIIFVEDDEDDKDFVCTVFDELKIPNKIVWLKDGEEAYHYLNNNNVDPFIIISDINMPKMNGLQLRDKMQTDGKSKLRAVPFLFLTTSTAGSSAINAYAQSVQGFFQKKSSYNELKQTIKLIYNYWKECAEPKFS